MSSVLKEHVCFKLFDVLILKLCVGGAASREGLDVFMLRLWIQCVCLCVYACVCLTAGLTVGNWFPHTLPSG